MDVDDETIRHIFHHLDKEPRINFNLTKNSRSVTWEITILGVRSVDEGIALLKEAERRMIEIYGSPS